MRRLGGLAGMACMADGSTPNRGPYGDKVEGCVNFIIAHGSESGLLAAEVSHGPMYDHDLANLMKSLPPQDQNLNHYSYGHYYAAQAMFISGDKNWSIWWPAVREELLARQEPEGFWRCQPGEEYGTAMALIILLMPNRLLPIFQK